jgi:hypothetical protein
LWGVINQFSDALAEGAKDERENLLNIVDDTSGVAKRYGMLGGLVGWNR